MEITGARWGVKGAEAVLKLRAVTASGDFDAYWEFHLEQEHSRAHQTRYATEQKPTSRLRLVKTKSTSSSS